MKKLIITIIVMSLVIGIFTSCENGNKNNNNETGNSECLIVDYTNNNIDGAITKEYTFWQYDRYLDSVS